MLISIEHVARQTRGEVERSDIQFPTGPGLNTEPDTRSRAVLQRARLREVEGHLGRHSELEGIQRRRLSVDGALGDAGADNESVSVLQGRDTRPFLLETGRGRGASRELDKGDGERRDGKAHDESRRQKIAPVQPGDFQKGFPPAERKAEQFEASRLHRGGEQKGGRHRRRHGEDSERRVQLGFSYSKLFFLEVTEICIF